MIVESILVMSIITFIILGVSYATRTNNTGKVWIISIALLILIWCTIEFFTEFSNIFIFFEARWFLSSLTLGSLSFFTLLLIDFKILKKRAKMLANETADERQIREEKEAKVREHYITNNIMLFHPLREEKEAKVREQARARVVDLPARDQIDATVQEHLIVEFQSQVRSQSAAAQRLQTASAQSYTELKCPKCGSFNLTANNKGFGLGKAAVGGILLGPVGLLGGLVGSKKVVFICLKCGNQFEK